MNLVDESRVVLWDRRRGITYSESDIVERFGVPPASIPDSLALVGDSADSIPGIARWGAKGTAAVLSEYGSLDRIPDSYDDWTVTVRGGKTLARNLADNREAADLYRTLATLRMDAPIAESLEDLHWQGVQKPEYLALCNRLGLYRLKAAPHKWR